ncbi:hypothetical protein [Nocardia sp. NPDC005745]|uniref:hypothetical protein n=1 Tax=Nocardia sp. NPDC005745 TaxID=3157061 RepID=UPI0033E5BC7C
MDASTADTLAHRSLAAGEDSTTSCVVITGAGRAFCVGADTHFLRPVERERHHPLAGAVQHRRTHRLALRAQERRSRPMMCFMISVVPP